jgi:small GTP-binding protein
MSSSINICVIGCKGAGATSIINRYINKEFNNNCKPTRGCNLYNTTITINDDKVILNIWDLSLNKKYTTAFSYFVERSLLYYIVVDISKPVNVEQLKKWIFLFDKSKKCYIVGNKKDIKMYNPCNELFDFIKKNNLEYLETSAKNDNGIDDLFNKIPYEINKQLDNNIMLKINKCCTIL